MTQTNLAETETRLARKSALEGPLGAWLEGAIAEAPNNKVVQGQLDAIDSDNFLLRFLHRFVLFNDALAARVPFLAGLIHLTPNIFLDLEADDEFCQQANGRIAAFIAEAASDEYRMVNGRNLVHQRLSQVFFRAALAHYGIDGKTFDRAHPVPPLLQELLSEARRKYFEARDPEQIFLGLGFHVGLEFFAHEEFNLVNGFLRSRHPRLVASLERKTEDVSPYLWLALHTVVEIEHYRAGLEALNAAVKYFHRPDETPRATALIKEGFAGFIGLQRRYYESIHCDAT